MLRTVWAVVRGGKIKLLEDVPLPEGIKVLVTLLSEEDERQFWLRVSDRSLADIGENTEDDVYAELIKK